MDKIDEILTRGVENIYPSKEALKKKLLSGEKLRIYLGIDPTSPNLHIGHGITLRKLRQFQDLGHEVILLIGDFTGMIGDPTGKSSARVSLTREQVLKNSEGYVRQTEKILDFKNKTNPAKIMFNSQWLDSLTFKDVIKVAALLTTSQMLNRDMFQKRLKNGGDVGIHELLYPMIHGYDSVAMDVDMEIGGNDQTFNMLVGRDLMKKIKGKEKFVLTTKLLTDPTGKKMGKTEGNMITLDDTADNMFGKIMGWPDSMIPLGFEICTDLEPEELQNPMEQKMKLSYEIVKVYHGEKSADKAQENFVNLFQKKEIDADNLKEIKVKKGSGFLDILVENNLIKSKSEARRLFESGAIDVDGKVIQDSRFKIQENAVVKIGKKIFVKIAVK